MSSGHRIRSYVAAVQVAPIATQMIRDRRNISLAATCSSICSMQHIEDPRGPVRVHERSRVREVTQELLASHPLMP